MIHFKNLELSTYLIAILVFVLLCLIFGNSHRRKVIKLLKKDYGFDLVKMSLLSQSRRRIRYVLLLLSTAILCFCLLRPQGKEVAQEKESSSRSILFLVDISKSMNVKDMNEQSRLEYSKWWAKKLMNDIPGDRFGLITFSKIANIECPLTSDPEMVLLYLSDLNSSLLPGGGTNIAAALDHAQKQFKENERDSRVVVLLSDGETDGDKWRESLDALQKKKIPVNVIGLGDPDRKGLVLDEKGHPIRNSKGNYVMSLSDTSTLKQIADETGGTYIPWDPEAPLESGHSTIESLIRELEFDESKKEQVKVREELYFFFLPLAILLLCIRLCLSETKNASESGKLLLFIIFFSFNMNLDAQAQLPQIAPTPAPQVDPEAIKQEILRLETEIQDPIIELQSYKRALKIEEQFQEHPNIIAEHVEKHYQSAAKHPELHLAATANLLAFRHRKAMQGEPAQQSQALEKVIDDYIDLISQYPDSSQVQENLDLAIQQKQKLDQQNKDQQNKDQQNKDQQNKDQQNKDQQNKDQQNKDQQNKDQQNKDQQNKDQQNKDQQNKDQQNKDQQNKDQQNKDQQNKDQQNKDQQNKDQKVDPNEQGANDKEQSKQKQEQPAKMTQDEANAAFQDELKRQQQLRDLIRRNREQRNKRQYFNPEQDK
ncbi:VWA domain-containing protein [Lentisphaera marina]|nr:VWA domain-containing protein [Lentisphaera marina]MDD7985698.1 VWA domain-containing protein [Lentisphaera marina]